MSRVKKTIGLDKIGIESLPVAEAVKQWLRLLVGQLEQRHREIRERAESGGFPTNNWRVKDDDDGHLIIQERIDGIWTDSGWRLKKA